MMFNGEHHLPNTRYQIPNTTNNELFLYLCNELN